MEARTDRELLDASDAEAFAAFYRRHERLVLGWLTRRTRTIHDAADLTTETFAAAWLARDSFTDEARGAAPWLLGIARNKLRMSARRQRLERSASERLGLERVPLDDPTTRSLEALFGDAEAWLEGLPEPQRAAVRAFVLDEERYADIAARMDVEEHAVRKRVSRGLARLRQIVRPEGASP